MNTLPIYIKVLLKSYILIIDYCLLFYTTVKTVEPK